MHWPKGPSLERGTRSPTAPKPQRGESRVPPRWGFAFVVPRIPRALPWAFVSRPFGPNRNRSSQSDSVRNTHSCDHANQCLKPNREVITTPFLSANKHDAQRGQLWSAAIHRRFSCLCFLFSSFFVFVAGELSSRLHREGHESGNEFPHSKVNGTSASRVGHEKRRVRAEGCGLA